MIKTNNRKLGELKMMKNDKNDQNSKTNKNYTNDYNYLNVTYLLTASRASDIHSNQTNKIS